MMALLAALEAAIPLRTRGSWNRVHLAPNLLLTLITFASNAVFNSGLVLLLRWQAASGVGLLHALAPNSVLAAAVVVLALDFTWYVTHVTMHTSAVLWRFHCVHHSDPAVDVTTTIRQHPIESVIRYLFLAGAASGLGAGPGAFAIYRAWSVLHGLAEHANVRLPQRLDEVVAWVVTTPNMHKVHHSRHREETNSNYGNIFSLFDRFFATFTPTARGRSIAYGLDGLDHPTMQTTPGLLMLPFRNLDAREAAGVARLR
jgi:sterol desaturase/sphingolipid hydroxylase (fatty acid hydroxylase superfamily)